jgi:hypothetical protein
MTAALSSEIVALAIALRADTGANLPMWFAIWRRA